MAYSYGRGWSSYAAAFDALTSMYADGDVSPAEVSGIVKRGKRWVVLLKGQ